ncbi:unnamed protein product [Agarophyton chilense]
MKTISAVVLAIIGFAAAVPATHGPTTTVPTAAPTTAPMMTHDDVMISLPSGVSGAASGNNAVAAGADKHAGAAAAKTDSDGAALAGAGPGGAIGFASNFMGPTPSM